ncbi:hypothetical protein BUALT_Bualt15G0045600 [Buddleja alternifolia]|uniref:BHLH domain-containing protein n=1 Tax=Buddleja alternifolia TaxID=168488 RepID=A0AAV6WEC2_9LAMI|nr:hypothetical protein BUALT_Bualt15G0045600 [Buddleja alternifolia]
MASNGGFDDDPVAPGSYSQMLFADDIAGLEPDINGCFSFTSSFTPSNDNNNHNNNNKSPKMLCFGDYAKQCDDVKVGVENSTKISTLPKSRKKRCGSGNEPGQDPDSFSGAPTGSKRNSKKFKSDNSNATVHAKVRTKKEKLGERITALQQLVSPFGKTDTTSVLHEALGYIRFLQDQVQVLSSPYLQRPLASPALHRSEEDGEKNESDRIRKDDLRSRGLCLVPVELILHVADDSNGADLWSSTAMISNVSTS